MYILRRRNEKRSWCIWRGRMPGWRRLCISIHGKYPRDYGSRGLTEKLSPTRTKSGVVGRIIVVCLSSI